MSTPWFFLCRNHFPIFIRGTGMKGNMKAEQYDPWCKKELEKDKNEWKNNTVLTLLSRLAEKKFLKIKKIGRRNEYTATVTEAEYQAMQTHRFLDKVYGGNVKNLASTLLRQDILSADAGSITSLSSQRCGSCSPLPPTLRLSEACSKGLIQPPRQTQFPQASIHPFPSIRLTTAQNRQR